LKEFFHPPGEGVVRKMRGGKVRSDKVPQLDFKLTLSLLTFFLFKSSVRTGRLPGFGSVIHLLHSLNPLLQGPVFRMLSFEVA